MTCYQSSALSRISAVGRSPWLFPYGQRDVAWYYSADHDAALQYSSRLTRNRNVLRRCYCQDATWLEWDWSLSRQWGRSSGKELSQPIPFKQKPRCLTTSKLGPTQVELPNWHPMDTVVVILCSYSQCGVRDRLKAARRTCTALHFPQKFGGHAWSCTWVSSKSARRARLPPTETLALEVLLKLVCVRQMRKAINAVILMASQHMLWGMTE